MIHGIAPIARRRDKGLEIGPSAALADKFGKPFGRSAQITALLNLATDQPVFAVTHLPLPIYWPSS